MDEETQKQLAERADALAIVPSLDTLAAEVLRIARNDDQLAALWAEKLRNTYTRVLENQYPELAAEAGDVLPIDTSVDPADLTYEYYMVDEAGFADWIDDDGQAMPSNAITASRHTGEMHEMGHRYEMTRFDLERASKAGVQLSSMKQNAARKAHARTTNWVWLFGDTRKGLKGLCNHPNIERSLAATGGSGRHFSVKTVDEILTDIAALIDEIPKSTKRAYSAAKVFIPLELRQRMRNLRLGAGDGFASLWDMVQERYKGDDQQPRVEFRVLNECSASMRSDPRDQARADTSGLSGDFMLAIPDLPPDEQAFIRARPYTQLPPQERDFVLHHLTHSRIGGCKLVRPTAVHRMDFGAAP